jgi:hypothetical protein
MQCGPSRVLVIIVSNRVILFLDDIHKRVPSGFDPKYSRLLCGFFLTVSLPPMFDMGDNLKECKGDIFPIGKIVERNNLLVDLTTFPKHLHIYLTFKYGNIKINLYLEGGGASKVVA